MPAEDRENLTSPILEGLLGSLSLSAVALFLCCWLKRKLGEYRDCYAATMTLVFPEIGCVWDTYITKKECIVCVTLPADLPTAPSREWLLLE